MTLGSLIYFFLIVGLSSSRYARRRYSRFARPSFARWKRRRSEKRTRTHFALPLCHPRAAQVRRLPCGGKSVALARASRAHWRRWRQHRRQHNPFVVANRAQRSASSPSLGARSPASRAHRSCRDGRNLTECNALQWPPARRNVRASASASPIPAKLRRQRVPLTTNRRSS